MLIYDTAEQARLRLRGSVITYKEKAVLVVDVKETRTAGILLTLQNYPLRGPGASASRNVLLDVPINDQELNFRLFNLGYMNDPENHRAHFITRQTRRQQSQGLVTSSLMASEGQRVSPGAFERQEFEDMLFGRYPTIDEATERLRDGGWESVAISRYFALAADPDIRLLRSLLYRGRRVGVALGTKFSEFLVDERDSYLSEVLRQAGFPFRTE